jgi:lipoyl(octanoyl) transferase
MDERVSAFAGVLRSVAPISGASEAIEWRVSPAAVPYGQAVAEMERRAAAILAGEASELIWLLEHPSLYTAGTSAHEGDLLDPARFPVHASGRGGQYTYHGPGQLVAYVLLDLNRRGRDVRCHVHRLEAWAVAALSHYGITGERREGRPGIWVRQREGDAKIGAIGVRVRRWVTYHGMAINVCPDLSHFTGIVPCGIQDAGVTSIAVLEADRIAEGRSATSKTEASRI